MSAVSSKVRCGNVSGTDAQHSGMRNQKPKVNLCNVPTDAMSMVSSQHFDMQMQVLQQPGVRKIAEDCQGLPEHIAPVQADLQTDAVG